MAWSIESFSLLWLAFKLPIQVGLTPTIELAKLKPLLAAVCRSNMSYDEAKRSETKRTWRTLKFVSGSIAFQASFNLMSMLKLQRNQKVFCTSFPCTIRYETMGVNEQASSTSMLLVRKERKKRKLIPCHRIFLNLHGLFEWLLKWIWSDTHTHPHSHDSMLHTEWTIRNLSNNFPNYSGRCKA